MAQPGSTHDAQSPVIQQQNVIIPNNHGEKLVGTLHETGSPEIVILCHGFRSSKEYTIMVNLAVALENEGISAFRFDFAGNGESEGSFQIGGYWREADDLHAVIQHFRGAKRVIHAILGHSKGGDVVLLYASKYHDVHMVLNVSGRYNLKRGIDEYFGKDFFERIKKDGFFDVKDKTGSFRVTEEGLMDRLSTDMHEACLKIEKDCSVVCASLGGYEAYHKCVIRPQGAGAGALELRHDVHGWVSHSGYGATYGVLETDRHLLLGKVLTIHGSADEIIPVEDAVEFAKIIPNHKLHIIEGANHGYTSHQAELALVALNFIRTGLQEGKDKP